MAEHECEYKERVVELEAIVAQQDANLTRLQADVAQLKKTLLGPKSERMPTPTESLRTGTKADPATTAARRKANGQVREEACTEEHEESLVPADQRACPACGEQAVPIKADKTSTIVEYVPGHFQRRIVHRETVACRCGDYVKTAPAPDRVLGQSKYGAGFVSHLVVSKLLDSMPIYRLEKRFKRLGIPMARSTMNDLLHRAAFELEPIHRRLLEVVAQQHVVLADETSLPVLAKKKCKRGFVWTFRTRLQLGGDDDGAQLIAYRYSNDRSGKTPSEILGGTDGVLVVDGFTGYNRVTDVDGRTRAACLAHVRRKFFDARAGNERLADQALELILDVYRVEHEALRRGIVRTEEHAELRRTQGRAAMTALHSWLKANEEKYPPRSSALGNAIRYALNNWERLCVFLDDIEVPPDNNASEASLRPIAKGRDNWLFAGNDDAAERLVQLLGLCATCEANDINPEEYLADVLARLTTHPAKDIDDLLPHRWRPLDVDG